MDTSLTRSGRFIPVNGEYRAFVPAPLPPQPPLQFDNEMLNLLSAADLSLGRLNGLASIINEPDLFVYLYVRKEALLSSQIEGTQCSLEDVLAEDSPPERKLDVEEVSNYVAAMNAGMKRMKQLPVSSRLIREIHGTLLRGTRGHNRRPGEYRTTQNWIGRPGAKVENAQFVPPPPQEIENCMGALEKYINENDEGPPLIRAALVHAQFETIHPFLDGNGRLGRLLITFLLSHWKVIEKPLVYLSYYFKANRTEYYAKLMSVRIRGDWEGWVKFFLRGIAETAQMANEAAIEIYQLHQRDLKRIQASKAPQMAIQVFNILSKHPIVTVPLLEKISKKPKPTVHRAVEKLESLGILKEVSGKQRNRKYEYSQYLDILRKDTATQIG